MSGRSRVPCEHILTWLYSYIWLPLHPLCPTRSNTPLSVVFANDFWGISLSDLESHKSYRPLTILSFRLNHWLHGLWAPGFHACNVTAHALVCLLYLWTCLGLGVSLAPSLGAALLFAANPIHTEAVSHAPSTNSPSTLPHLSPPLPPQGCKRSGQVRDASCSLLPTSSHFPPEVGHKKSLSFPLLGGGNSGPLYHLPSLQGARHYGSGSLPCQRGLWVDRQCKETPTYNWKI